jgi:hypothetical protein
VDLAEGMKARSVQFALAAIICNRAARTDGGLTHGTGQRGDGGAVRPGPENSVKFFVVLLDLVRHCMTKVASSVRTRLSQLMADHTARLEHLLRLQFFAKGIDAFEKAASPRRREHADS